MEYLSWIERLHHLTNTSIKIELTSTTKSNTSSEKKKKIGFQQYLKNIMSSIFQSQQFCQVRKNGFHQYLTKNSPSNVPRTEASRMNLTEKEKAGDHGCVIKSQVSYDQQSLAGTHALKKQARKPTGFKGISICCNVWQCFKPE